MPAIALTGQCLPEDSTVASFLTNLPEFIGALLVDERCVVAIADFSDDRYVQFWLDTPQHFSVEVVSNAFLDDDHELSEDDESTLDELCFIAPTLSSSPNWHWTGRSMGEFAEIVRVTSSAVSNVLSKSGDDVVTIRTFEVERRERSGSRQSASPQPR